MTTHAAKDPTPTTVTLGHVIGGAFSMAFVIANSRPMPGLIRAACIIAAVSIVVLTVLSFGRGVSNGSITKPEDADESFNRRYWLLVAVEALALIAGLVLLNQWRPSAVVGWIALVVGLHFFGLARLWKSGSAEITLIAFGLTVLGMAGLFTADSLDAVGLVSGVGSGVVLLASSLTGAYKSLNH